MTELSLSGFEPVFVILLVSLLNAIWVWPVKLHPMTLVRILAIKMGDKVLPNHSQPVLQHYISSSLGFCVLIIPSVIALYIVLGLAEFPWFFDALLLLIALDFNQSSRQFTLVRKALGRDKKLLAREMLTPMVARETASLSQVGIAKAAIESLLLRYYKQFCAVMFWYVVAGPVMALLYRITLEFAWVWNTRRPGYRHFGLIHKKAANAMALIPCILAAFCMLIVTSPVGAWQAMRRSPHQDTCSILLSLFGGGLNIQLGGPAIYGGKKRRYRRVGGTRLVKFSDMTYCFNAIQRNMILWIVFLVLFSLLKVATLAT